jgi:hypothetical protein
MVAIPLVSLVGLWVFAVSVTVPEAISDHNLNVSTTASDTQGRALAVDLPIERAQTYLWLLSGRRASEAALLATRADVHKAIPPAVAAMRTQDGLLSAGPGGRRRGLAEPDGRVPGVQQHHRQPEPPAPAMGRCRSMPVPGRQSPRPISLPCRPPRARSARS